MWKSFFLKFIKYGFSMSFTGALLLVFAGSMGVATFIENDFGAIGAQSVVYRARWFELLMLAMVVNMIGIIFLKKMYQPKKWVNLLFHSAFIVILLGAGVTRFFGLEGMMHIREGKSSNNFISESTYISTTILDGDLKKESNEKVLFSRIKNNKYKKSIVVNSKEVVLEMKGFIFNATEVIEHDEEKGKPVLTLVTAGSKGRENKYLFDGKVDNIGKIPVCFNVLKEELKAINFLSTDTGLVFSTPFPMRAMSMDSRELSEIAVNLWTPVSFRTLYTVGKTNFVVTGNDPKGILKIISAQPENNAEQTRDAVIMKVSTSGDAQEVVLFGGRGYQQTPVYIEVGGINLSVSYGSRIIELPFSITLKDFQLERYPGSMSPSSYASEVVVSHGSVNYPFRIYMNHILDYGGYRFFQSSYDQDEKGTVLSVNKDKIGTTITYIGYSLLAIGLIAIILSKKTRFHFLSTQIDKVHKKRKKLATLLVGAILIVSPLAGKELPIPPPVQQAEDFGLLIYQTQGGRMAPINSLANDLLRKVYKKGSYNGYTSEQVILGMMSKAHEWQKVPLIFLKEKRLQKVLGVKTNYASYRDFFDEKGGYKLTEEVNLAHAKKPSLQSVFDKAILKVDERVNISYMIYQGIMLKIFPVPNDKEEHWVSPLDKNLYTLSGEDSVFVRKSVYQYFRNIAAEEYKQANVILKGIKKYQSIYGAKVMPTEQRVSMEILFNKWYIFKRLFPFYLLVGLALMTIAFVRILRPTYQLFVPTTILVWTIVLGFLIHTIGLGIRWYISDHAPWSNGYEAMIYIAWTTVLAGVIFSKKSIMTLGVTAFLSGIILFVAHLSFLDPQITNLVPVLKSYWLIVHVATITASYGFMALGALLAFLNLSIMIFKNKKNNYRLSLSIEELTYVIEMALNIGLILLTIGNFLGGVWANESWGRYWGWDPKETWALASIIFYAFVLHMRFIPGLKSIYAFNLASLVALSSIIMTFFGVNYYLSGLHSYAAGDPMPIPSWVYYSIITVVILGILSFWRNSKFKEYKS